MADQYGSDFITIMDEDGMEYAINPYPQLLYLWNYGKNELKAGNR